MSTAGALDKTLAVPLYHQLLAVLKANIDTRKWRADEQLPTETRLAEQFGVSKITVRQALQGLANIGYIRREHGKGTFVAQRKFDEGPRELTSFSEEMRRHDFAPSSRILQQTLAGADAKVAHALGIEIATPVFTLKRIRCADGEPMSVQTAYIPATYVPDLQIAEDASLYDVLQLRYQLYPARARETYFATLADARSAAWLGIRPGSAVFQVERVTLLPNEKPFEFVQSMVRGDRYTIVLDLHKEGKQGPASALRPVVPATEAIPEKN